MYIENFNALLPYQTQLLKQGMLEHKLYRKEGNNESFSEKTMQTIRRIISHYPAGKEKSALLPLLHIAQEELGGYLSVDVMDYIAQIIGIPAIEVYEVATFYSQYYLEKTGKFVIEVCQTGPCAMCGGEEIASYLEEKLNIKTGETTSDGLFTLRKVECLGACGYAPVMQINTIFYEFLTKEKMDEIIAMYRSASSSSNFDKPTWVEKFS
jgi:NADH-quinone oxidoreductase subunit E